MNINITGINYKKTPIEIREKISLTQEQQEEVLLQLRLIDPSVEAVVLSTCNRTEVYFYGAGIVQPDKVEAVICKVCELDIYEMKKYFYCYSRTSSVKHIFRVACGLDSMVFGEDQILGQIKQAHEQALKLKVSGSILNTLFRQAVTVAKKIKTCTGLSRNPVSLGTLVLKRLEDIFGVDIIGKKVLIIGAGKIGVLALRNISEKPLDHIYLTNRTHSKAEDISRQFNNVECIDYMDRYDVMNQCDIIISSTSSPHYTITKDVLEKSLTINKQRVFIDLALPRDIDSSISEIEKIEYFNIDDFKASACNNLDKKLKEAEKAEDMIGEFVEDFERWYSFKNALPVVKEIQRFAGDIVEDKMSQMSERLSNSSSEDVELIRSYMSSTVNALLDKFIYSIKETGNKEDIEAYFRCLAEVVQK